MTLPTPNPATNRQVPDQAIMDMFGKQSYLGNQFIAGSGVVALADTAEHNLFYIANAAANLKALFNRVRNLMAGDATNIITFRIYKNPTTVAAGTDITPINCRFASPLIAVATCKTAPTSVSKGTLVATYVVSSASDQDNNDQIFIVDPGLSILITAQASAASSAAVELVWWEL